MLKIRSSTLNSINSQSNRGDVHDHVNEHHNHFGDELDTRMSSETYKNGGHNLDLDMLTILYLSWVSYSTRSELSELVVKFNHSRPVCVNKERELLYMSVPLIHPA
jgi:hypothetical protein